MAAGLSSKLNQTDAALATVTTWVELGIQTRFVVFDMGLHAEDEQHVKVFIDELRAAHVHQTIDFVVFPFDAFPEHLHFSHLAKGSEAWKVGLR